ncbi:MAG TPA: hypothetical protein VFG20_09020, partial [Planctomycetaceae bacterium]|nr:hypothetical protein [Planctomycetaceae bacterium]
MPRTDGAGLIVPDWDTLPALVEQNRAQRELAAKIDVQGVSLGDLRRLAQAAAKTLARNYLANTLQLSVPDWVDGAPLIVGGHQPELFHAGVWAKNFAVAR